MLVYFGLAACVLVVSAVLVHGVSPGGIERHLGRSPACGPSARAVHVADRQVAASSRSLPVHYVSCPWFDAFRGNPWAGVRVGEASHPGPSAVLPVRAYKLLVIVCNSSPCLFNCLYYSSWSLQLFVVLVLVILIICFFVLPCAIVCIICLLVVCIVCINCGLRLVGSSGPRR